MLTRSVLLIAFLVNFVFITVGVLIGNPPEQYFSKEATYITWVSFFQLLIVAYLAWSIFKNKSYTNILKSPALLWVIIAIGFLYLALDEVIRIHENLDNIIHRVFHLKQTAFTDRLDDAIVGFYGLIGIVVLYIFRVELKKHKKSLPIFLIGFSFFFLMVIADMSVNNNDVIRMFVSDKSMRHIFYSALKIFEEVFKLIAECFFIGAFYSCLLQSKQKVIVNE